MLVDTQMLVKIHNIKLFFFNFCRGINVLASKSELQKVMEKRNQHRKIQEKMTEQNSNKTPFQIKLEERAKRLEQVIVTGCLSKGTFML